MVADRTSRGSAARPPRSTGWPGFGFRIPPGFCLTTDAFAAQVATLPGSDRPRGRPGASWPTRRRAPPSSTRCSPVRWRRPSRPRSPPRSTAWRASSAPTRRIRLRLAVRSSGVAEDGAAASFAGPPRHGARPDRRTRSRPAVLRCWASLWSDRAIGYRTRRGLPLDGGAMAVVVQALVPAAGRGGRLHPPSGHRPGRPDPRQRGAGPRRGDGVGPRHAGHDRRRQGEPRPSSSSRRATSRAAPRPADDAARRAGRPVPRRRARRSGRPVDIEAAFATDGWYLLQARPITTREERHDVRRAADRRFPDRLARAGRRRADLGLGRHAHADRGDAAGRRLQPPDGRRVRLRLRAARRSRTRS